MPPPASAPCLPHLRCSMHGSSIPQFPIQHGQFSSQRHMQKKKNTAAAKTLNDSDGALQLTNRQWDRQANRRSDSGTGSSRTAAQHTLGQLHTNTHTLRHTGTPRQGVSSHSLAAVPAVPGWVPRHGGTTTNTNTTTVARIGGLVLMAAAPANNSCIFVDGFANFSLERRKLKQAAIFVWVVKHRTRIIIIIIISNKLKRGDDGILCI